MNRGEKVLVTGGCRSGKSAYAMALVQDAPSKLYVATATVTDDEMAERVRRHRQDRGPSWRTVEEPIDLARVLDAEPRPGEPVVVDCLTTWVANLTMADETQAEQRVMAEVEKLVGALARLPSAIVLVANEVGSGVVPPYPMGRQFRDLAGLTSQRVGQVVDRIVLMVAGYPLPVKRPGGGVS